MRSVPAGTLWKRSEQNQAKLLILLAEIKPLFCLQWVGLWKKCLLSRALRVYESGLDRRRGTEERVTVSRLSLPVLGDRQSSFARPDSRGRLSPHGLSPRTATPPREPPPRSLRFWFNLCSLPLQVRGGAIDPIPGSPSSVRFCLFSFHLFPFHKLEPSARKHLPGIALAHDRAFSRRAHACRHRRP